MFMHFIDQFAVIAKNYINKTREDPVYPDQNAIENLSQLDKPLQDEPVNANDVLDFLNEFGSPATVKSTGGRYFGFVTGGSLPAAMSAKLLATVWDQNGALTLMSPVASAIENIAGKWLLEIFSLPADSGFGFVTGDTMANFTALAAARHSVLRNLGWDVVSKGLFSAPEINVIVGEEVHISVLKVLNMLGLGLERVIRVPVGEQGRMIAEKIPVSDDPTIICAQSGNVNSGAFDDIEAICKRKGKNTWVHVDGAFGLWAAASPQKKYLVKGIELADSWATDGHKWLNVPYDCGIVFVRDKGTMFSSMSATSAAYIPTNTLSEPFQYVPEMSRQARAVSVWAALRSLGTSGLADLIEKNCNQAKQFADALTAAGFIILNDVVLNQVLVHFGDLEKTNSIIKNIQEEGVCWCGGTVWQGKPAMRISVSSWATTDEDVKISVQSIIKHASA
jgi:glutamate/tyrosine decarboxylase-like PLP-dependent enzyme